jgi:hypothetical protein
MPQSPAATRRTGPDRTRPRIARQPPRLRPDPAARARTQLPARMGRLTRTGGRGRSGLGGASGPLRSRLPGLSCMSQIIGVNARSGRALGSAPCLFPPSVSP